MNTWSRPVILLLSIMALAASAALAIAPAPQAAGEEPLLLIAQAQGLLAQGQFQDALTVLDRLLAIDPGNAEAHAWRGNALGSLSERAPDMMSGAQYGMAALAAFEKALTLDPANPTGLFGRGVANLSAPPPFGSIDVALADLQKLVALVPDHVEGRFYLGLALLRKGDPARARKQWQQGLELDPLHSQTRAELDKLPLAPPPAAAAIAPVPGRAEAVAASFAFTHVTVIDPRGNPPQRDMTVLASDGRIAALGKSGEVAIPPGTQVVDGLGKFVIPGLWDMHMHILGEPVLTLPLYLANGVTGVRYMGGSVLPEQWPALRQAIAAGTILGPRLYASGPFLDGPEPFWPNAIVIRGPRDGERAVADLATSGVDFLKIYQFLPREAYFAIARAAKQRGIPFAGHVPLAITASEAAEAGQRSIEHLDGILLACSRRFAELDMLRRRNNGRALLGSAPFKNLLDDYDEKRADELFSLFAAKNVWQVPTLSVFAGLIRAREEGGAAGDPRLKYIPAAIRQFFGWNPENPDKAQHELKYFRRWAILARKIVAALNAKQVPILAGTDSPYVFCFPGFSLHDELALLVAAGLTNREALCAATWGPAVFLGRQDSLGTVEAGKAADMVLLDGDPLQDIRHTQSIVAVAAAGRLLTRTDLDAMLEKVAVQVAAASTSSR